MAKGKFVAYYRVSTDRQGRSGLGLDAQRKAVTDYLNGGDWDLIEDFTEVESGKRIDNRPKLAAALGLCRREKATLIIARLDRLARNVAFVATLMESKVNIVAADMPSATPFMLHVYAAVAEEERRTIARRTKAALAAAKERGVVLGKQGKVNQLAADQRAAQLANMVRALRAEHPTVRSLTDELNRRAVPTPNGGRWHLATTHRLLRRIETPKATT